MHEAESLLRS